MTCQIIKKITIRLKVVIETLHNIIKINVLVKEKILPYSEVILILIPSLLKRMFKKTLTPGSILRKRLESYQINIFETKDNPYVNLKIKNINIFIPSQYYQKDWIQYVFDEIFTKKIYENKYVKVLTNDVVIDAGACEGFFTLYSLEKGAYVHAFEPNPYMAKALRKTIDWYKYNKKAKVHTFGLSDSRNYNELVIVNNNVIGTVFSDSELNYSLQFQSQKEHVKVETVTLDQLYEDGVFERVDFIKADIEGYERRMVIGAEKVIKKFRPKLAISYYHLPDDLETLIRIIKDFNPSYRLAINDEVLFAWDENH